MAPWGIPILLQLLFDAPQDTVASPKESGYPRGWPSDAPSLCYPYVLMWAATSVRYHSQGSTHRAACRNLRAIALP
jgi:hypothetical protein